jgi:hypothetical protein
MRKDQFPVMQIRVLAGRVLSLSLAGTRYTSSLIITPLAELRIFARFSAGFYTLDFERVDVFY